MCGVERLPIDLGPRNAQQAGLEADAGLAGLVTVLEGEGFGKQITEREPDQYLQIALDGRHEPMHDSLRLLAGHATLEMRVLDVVDTAPEGGDGDTQEGSPLFRRHFPDTVEITDTGGVKIEILRGFVC